MRSINDQLGGDSSDSATKSLKRQVLTIQATQHRDLGNQGNFARPNRNQLRSSTNTENMFELRLFRIGDLQSCVLLRSVVPTLSRGSQDMEGRRHALSSTANWLTRTSSSHTKSPHHVRTTISSSKKSWKRCKNCQTFALESFLNAFVLVRTRRPDMLWSVNKLARAITSGSSRVHTLSCYPHSHTSSCV